MRKRIGLSFMLLLIAAGTAYGAGESGDTSAKKGCEVQFYRDVGGVRTAKGKKHIEEGETVPVAGCPNCKPRVCKDGKMVTQ